MKYRAREEEQAYRDRDPITGFKRRVLTEGLLTAADCETIEKKAVVTVEIAVQAAEQAPLPSPEECLTDVYVTYP
jgi:TPP-dependent pyruvate/acetoin dehydrogenase alpha subunit